MRPLVLTGLAAGVLALHAPTASADHVNAQCRFNAIQQDTLTAPDRFEGHAQGWALAYEDTVTVRCVIVVNGVEAASTAPGTPTETVAVTAGRISYTARDIDVVHLCPVVTTRHGEEWRCWYSPPPPPPPLLEWLLDAAYDTYDTVNDLVIEHVDPRVCPALADLSPGTPPVFIDAEGDVYVNGEPVWDCPPYDIWP